MTTEFFDIVKLHDITMKVMKERKELQRKKCAYHKLHSECIQWKF